MAEFNGRGTNPNDPLQQKSAAPERIVNLVKNMGKVADGHSMEEVIGASANILLNCLRQMNGNRAQAERHFDELFGRVKNVLLEQHYDAVTGKRRTVFPFNQNLDVPLMRKGG